MLTHNATATPIYHHPRQTSLSLRSPIATLGAGGLHHQQRDPAPSPHPKDPTGSSCTEPEPDDHGEEKHVLLGK